MPLFEDQTPDVIKSRILARMDTDLQTREGSYSSDMAAPVSFELWRVLMTMGELISAFYVDENSGPYLDEHAAMLGLTRREGAAATAEIAFAGNDGVVVPAGTAFFTEDGLQFDLDADVTLESGMGTGTLTASEIGEAYNVDEGEIVSIGTSIAGLSEFTASAAEGGAEAESDASLFARIEFRRQSPTTSGNENHYKQWALSCEGVGAVWVNRLWNGPGTVRVLIAGYDLKPVDDAIVEACAAYIETQRPVGAEVTVVSVAGTPINVSATLTLEAGVSTEMVQDAFSEALTAYFLETGEKLAVVHYHRVAAILMGVDGVTDYDDLLVAGGTSNVRIDSDSVPVVGEVRFT